MNAAFCRIFLAASLTLLPTRAIRAHPAHAEEVNHPFVAGFERFFSKDDAADYLRQGGELLLSELNCVGCHKPPANLAERFPGAPGPNLRGVAARIADPAVLQMLVRNPRFLKRGTRMPSLFAASDRDPAELEALFHFLLTLDETDDEPLLLGLPERGKEHYHTVGCVACHAVDVEYRPAALAAGVEAERPAMASMPIRLAAYWSADYLTRYLAEPGKFHPAGRMPNLGLSEQEAADVAAYLQAGPTLSDPSAKLPAADADLARLGRDLFRTKGCTACHHDLGMEHTRAAPSLTELPAENVGCLAELPTQGAVPFYFLGNLQREAMKLALAKLGEKPGNSGNDPDERLVRELTRWDCFACHSANGRGGPELAREPFFGAGDPRALDRENFLPPALDGLKSRRTREEVLEIFAGEAKRRKPQVKSRMIRVLPENRKKLADLLLGESPGYDR